MGPYCRYCDHRCFALRCLPDTGRQLLMATCPAGEDHDQVMIGYTHKTATNPAVGGARSRQEGTGLSCDLPKEHDGPHSAGALTGSTGLNTSSRGRGDQRSA